jgi:hypothetical protein
MRNRLAPCLDVKLNLNTKEDSERNWPVEVAFDEPQ